MRAAVIAVVLGGCEAIFPLVGPDGGVAQIPPCNQVGQVISLPLVADTYVGDGDQTAHGSESSLITGTTQRILVRFRLGELRLEDVEFTLVLHKAVLADECGGVTCAPCAQAGVGTAFPYQLTRPDWDETAATELLREPGVAWSAAGPSGTDVMPPAPAEGTSTDDENTSTVMGSILMRDPSWQTDELSLLLVDPASIPVQHFYVSRSNECGAPPPPTLSARCVAVSP